MLVMLNDGEASVKLNSLRLLQ